MTVTSPLPNPKQNGVPYVGRLTWFPYYAGFSSVFVASLLRHLNCSAKTVVCDPWNGAGTTTQSAFDAGIPCVGIDLNPVMTRVALARTVAPQNAKRLLSQHVALVREARSRRSRRIQPHDPLRDWFADDLVRGIRYISKTLDEPTHEEIPLSHQSLYETAVFRTMKSLLKPFRSSNPTWIRRPSARQRVNGTVRRFLDTYDTTVRQMIAGFEGELSSMPKRYAPVRIETASSLNLPLNDNSVDRVIGSPPYCTRIDYAVTTSVELAYLGLDVSSSDRSIRHSMTGTSTIRPEQPQMRNEWGPTCRRFLNGVKRHPSKSSESYYLKTHLQYFDDLYQSLKEISRVLSIGGDAVLVVQDSYYKEIHNDLTRMVVEMADSTGLRLVDQQSFPVVLDMARVNPKADPLRIANRPVESVIHFNK